MTALLYIKTANNCDSFPSLFEHIIIPHSDHNSSQESIEYTSTTMHRFPNLYDCKDNHVQKFQSEGSTSIISCIVSALHTSSTATCTDGNMYSVVPP